MSALDRQMAANRTRTAAWITQQVTPGTTISCDQAMCRALEAAGYPERALSILGPTSQPPLSSTLVIETAWVRSQFGSSMDSAIAPVAITTVGSGQARVSVRLVAPHGATALLNALAAGQRARRENEAALQGGGQMTTSPAASAVLASGRADMRLVVAITYMASLPIDIEAFGNMATGGSARMPLRYADLAESDDAAHLSSKQYVAALKAAVGSVPSPYRPLWAKSIRLRTGVSVLRIDMGVPSPLGWPTGITG
jgi:hypothetical protein